MDKSDSENKQSEKLKSDDKKVEEELEEGEILDDDDTSMLETFVITRNVCKFFLRGRCSWGPECNFLHCVPTDNGDYKLEPVKSVESHLTYNVTSAITETIDVWEHGLRMSKNALYRQTRNYSPERQDSTYEPEYFEIPPRESCRTIYKHEDQDMYRSRRPKREVSISREKEAWTDSWRRLKSSTSPKKRRKNSSSSSDCSSDSSHKKHNRRNRDNQRFLNRQKIKERNRSDKFQCSRERITTNHEKVRRKGETKRSRSIEPSSSSSDSDRSVSKTRNRSKKRRSHGNLKENRQRSSSPPTVPKRDYSAKKNSKRKVLLEKLNNIEIAIAKHKKLNSNK